MLAALAILLAACGGGGNEGGGAVAPPAPPPSVEPEVFSLDSFVHGRLRVQVWLDGVPLPRASLSVEDTKRPPAEGEILEDSITGGCYFRGVTLADGEVTVPLRVPSRYDGVDVIVHVPGTHGPYDHEALRAMWGPTAPSARVHVRFSDLPTDPEQALDVPIELRSR